MLNFQYGEVNHISINDIYRAHIGTVINDGQLLARLERCIGEYFDIHIDIDTINISDTENNDNSYFSYIQIDGQKQTFKLNATWIF